MDRKQEIRRDRRIHSVPTSVPASGITGTVARAIIYKVYFLTELKAVSERGHVNTRERT